MSTVFLTVADQFAAASFKQTDVTVQWFKNATRRIMPQGGLVGFISFKTFSDPPYWGVVSTSFDDVSWTRVGDKMYCVGVLCADGDLGGASAQPVAVFSRKCDPVRSGVLQRVDRAGQTEKKTRKK